MSAILIMLIALVLLALPGGGQRAEAASEDELRQQIEDLQQELLKADPKALLIIQEGVHVSNNFERRLN